MHPRSRVSWKPPGVATLSIVAGLAMFASRERLSPQQVVERLWGTFRLTSFRQTDVASGERREVFGKAPRGFISYGRDGRMLVLIVASERRKPSDLVKMTAQERADLFNTMVAYGGTYTFDGKTVVHHVDISWNEGWTGTDQVRNATFDGQKLVLSTNPQPSLADGKMSVFVLTWEKVE